MIVVWSVGQSRQQNSGVSVRSGLDESCSLIKSLRQQSVASQARLNLSTTHRLILYYVVLGTFTDTVSITP